MFRSLLLAAILAAVPASLLLTLGQALWVTPLILEAEVYERGGIPGELPLEALDGARLLSTALANGVLTLGFALLLVGIYALRTPEGPKRGLFWGMAGFSVFFLAPSLGLPPELPGTESADLVARQLWWLGTVLATATALPLIVFGAPMWRRWVGWLLLILPHGIGAPYPEVAGSLAPEALQWQFRVATLLNNLFFWGLLGIFSAISFRRLATA
jgi:cobalt transporter subunit CbtA